MTKKVNFDDLYGNNHHLYLDFKGDQNVNPNYSNHYLNKWLVEAFKKTKGDLKDLLKKEHGVKIVGFHSEGLYFGKFYLVEQTLCCR